MAKLRFRISGGHIAERRDRVDLISAQRIHAIVEEEARRLSASKATQARAVLATGTALPRINQEIAIYDAHTEEVLLFDNGI